MSVTGRHTNLLEAISEHANLIRVISGGNSTAEMKNNWIEGKEQKPGNAFSHSIVKPKDELPQTTEKGHGNPLFE